MRLRNFLQRLRAAALLPSLALLWQPPSHAATITVDSTSDGFGLAECTLRAAIAAANNDAPAQGCDAGAGDDVIEFDRSVQGGRITLVNGALTVSSSLAITGSSSRPVTISGDDASSVLIVSDGNASEQTVTLTNLILTGGFNPGAGGGIFNDENLTLNRCEVTSNRGTSGGGGIRNQGTLTLTNSTVSGNSSVFGAGAGIQSTGPLTLTNTDVLDNESGSIYSGGGISHSSNNLVITGGRIAGNSAGTGGGLLVFDATATLTTVLIENNNAAENGGGLQAINNSSLTLDGVTLQGNMAADNGGGLSAANSEITVQSSTFSDNVADNFGGGMHLSAIDGLSIASSTISGNTAAVTGGGVYSASGNGTATITNSLFSGNRAETLNGGGLFLFFHTGSVSDTHFAGNFAGDSGGGIFFSPTSSLNVTASTFSGNSAINSGSAISVDTESFVLSNSTLSTNEGADAALSLVDVTSATIRHATFVDNTSSTPDFAVLRVDASSNASVFNSGFAGTAPNCGGAALLAGSVNNAFSDLSCAIAGEVDPLIADLQIGPLADNGGPTPTHLPLPGSPLIEAAAIAECEATDQTGMPRPIDGNADGLGGCDIGAVEYVDMTGPASSLDSPDVSVGGGTVYVVAVTYDDADAPLNLGTLDVGDISVTPGPLAITGITVSGDEDVAVAQYSVTPPGSAWDDADNGDYNVSLNADEVLDTAATGANASTARSLGTFTVAVGEIDVTGNGQSIPAGSAMPLVSDGTDFGQVMVGSSAVQTFVLTNQALGEIELQGMIVVTGTGFSVTDQTFPLALGPGASSPFEVTFNPVALGDASATVSIASNDGDENPYTFSLRGQGVALVDEIFADSFE